LLATQISKQYIKIYLCTIYGRHLTQELNYEENSKKDNCEDPDIILPKTGFTI